MNNESEIHVGLGARRGTFLLGLLLASCPGTSVVRLILAREVLAVWQELSLKAEVTLIKS